MSAVAGGTSSKRGDSCENEPSRNLGVTIGTRLVATEKQANLSPLGIGRLHISCLAQYHIVFSGVAKRMAPCDARSVKLIDIGQADRVVWAIVSALSILAVQSAAATNILQTSAIASVQSGGITYDLHQDTTSPGGSVTASAAGTSSAGAAFDGMAHAFVDASNYGELRFSGSESMTGTGQSNASAGARIVDTWLLSDSGLTGQTAIANVSAVHCG